MLMANVDFVRTPVVEPNDTKIFGTVETPVDFAKTFGNDVSLKRALSALQRGPIRFYRDNVIACDEDTGYYIFFVVSGVVRSCKACEGGAAQCRRLLSSWRSVWLDGSEAIALPRSSHRHPS